MATRPGLSLRDLGMPVPIAGPGTAGRKAAFGFLAYSRRALQCRRDKGGQCRGRRLPMGRRRQGQDRRLAVRARRCRRALPGRPQCRPYARGRRHHLQALAAPLGRGAQGQALGDRQRRGDRPLGAWPRRSPRSRSSGSSISRDNLRIAENATLILPLHRELDALREAAAGDGRIGTTKRGIGPAYEDKVGRRAIRVMDLQDLPSLKPKIERILAHHNPLRSGLGEPEISADDLCAQLHRDRAEDPPYVDTVWALLDAKTPAGQAHPVRGRARRAARHRPRHLSVRHLVQHGCGAGRDRIGPRARRHQLRARHHQGLHDAGGGGACSRPSSRTRPAC